MSSFIIDWFTLVFPNNNNEPLTTTNGERSHKGHNRNNLSIKDTSYEPKCSLSQISTSEERTTSLQIKDKIAGPTSPIFRGFTVY